VRFVLADNQAIVMNETGIVLIRELQIIREGLWESN
jgi:hypothetical protein